jgi:hypothetical protein
VCAEPGTDRVAVVYATRGASSALVTGVVFDAAGAIVHTYTLRSAGVARMRAGGCSFSGTGQLAIGGQYSGTVDFGGGVMRTGETYGDGFLATYATSDGSLVDVITFGTGTTDDPIGVAFAPGGDRVITGGVGGVPLVLGTTTVNGAFAARIRSDGSYAWVLPLAFAHYSGERLGFPAVDASGITYLPGTLVASATSSRTVMLAGVSHTVAARSDEAVVVSIDALGAGRWVSSVSIGYATGGVPSVAADADGMAYFAGTYDVGSGYELPATMGWGAFVVAMRATTGAHVYSRTLDERYDDFATGIAVRGSYLAVVGRASGAIDLGGGVVPANNDDVWLSEYED